MRRCEQGGTLSLAKWKALIKICCSVVPRQACLCQDALGSAIWSVGCQQGEMEGRWRPAAKRASPDGCELWSSHVGGPNERHSWDGAAAFGHRSRLWGPSGERWKVGPDGWGRGCRCRPASKLLQSAMKPPQHDQGKHQYPKLWLKLKLDSNIWAEADTLVSPCDLTLPDLSYFSILCDHWAIFMLAEINTVVVVLFFLSSLMHMLLLHSGNCKQQQTPGEALVWVELKIKKGNF